MAKSVVKPALFRMSVEEENLGSIPFAVLESRVGKRIAKLEIQGTKTLPDGQELRVSWQVQGNSELGLPTEQDLDIFVALGVLTFRSNFEKTITFTGREIARILGISGVHGKFYQRLKLAMDRFVPLRFRAITATDRQEEVKWINVFQEASFTLDRQTGRCTGMVTWTDKLIQSMNSGFFRVLDAGRYMDLDGITVKHMYRFLAVAFEKADVIVIDARKLSAEHLGIVKLPKYFSRLLQTLEPAFDQLTRIEVLGSYHIVNSDRWEVALHRHRNYVPERKSLLQDSFMTVANMRTAARAALVDAGLNSASANALAEAAVGFRAYHQLERAARLLKAFIEFGILSNVAVGTIEKALKPGAASDAARDQLDWCEIAVQTCQQKMDSGQKLKNPAGLILRILRDEEARDRVVGQTKTAAAMKQFRQREHHLELDYYHAEQRQYVLEYERFRTALATAVFGDMSETARQALRADKIHILRQQGRWERMDARAQQSEIDELVRQEIALKEAPPFEKWLLRKRAAQAVLPFTEPSQQAVAH
jgi:hypothetical protein